MEIANLLASSESDVDLYVHGLFSYELFGQTFWITNSHVCILIVMLLMVSFALVVNIKMRHATEVPGTLQNIAVPLVTYCFHTSSPRVIRSKAIASASPSSAFLSSSRVFLRLSSIFLYSASRSLSILPTSSPP